MKNIELRKRIDSSSVLNQGRAGLVKAEWIADAEKKLAKRLPSSYKWWLLSCGCGWIDGYPICTIAPPDFSETADSDIVTANLTHRKDGIADQNRLYFYEPDGDERYFLDVSQEPVGEEYPVMLESLTEGATTECATDFASFLAKIIELRATPDEK